MRVLAVAVAVSLLSCTSSPPSSECTRCGSDCVDFKLDDANCGSCSKACSTGERCAQGTCYPAQCGGQACDPGAICFDGGCTPRACVGVLCGLGQVCSNGVCSCASDRTDCGGRCADTRLSDSDCGACGHACDTGFTCAGGGCLPSDCPTQPCDGLSACYQGICAERACIGVICAPGLECHSGACGCSDTETLCDGRCSLTRTDSQNCGTCGHACAASERCAAGSCLPADCSGQSCDPTSVCVQSACVAAACVGVVCPAGQSCSGGVCACPQGQAPCAAGCTALATDDMNCGVCGTRCETGQSCIGGNCTVSGCAAGKRVCGGACVDLQTNPDNCGACGNACGGGRNCVAGACQCPPALAYCTGNCVDLLTDSNNCNGCGRSCMGGTCSAGVCQCPPQQTLCSGVCRATQTDPMNCNTCGHACASSQTCNAGACVCAPGTTLCGGTCIPTQNDSLNCGGCNNVCPVNTNCVNSTCQPFFVCQTNFASAPADCPLIPVDASLCGKSTQQSVEHFSGAPGNMVETHPFTCATNERVEITGTQGAANGTTTLLSTTSLTLQSASSYVSNLPIDFVGNGSIFPCANPAEVTSGGCNVYACGYAYDVIHYSVNGRYNNGGTAAASATPLVAGASGRICDQVCGDLTGLCSDTRQTYKFGLPAGKAAVIEGAFTGSTAGSTFSLIATDNAGGLLCNLVPSGSATNVGQTYRARIVNNSPTAQTVQIAPLVKTGALGWNLSVAVEP